MLDRADCADFGCHNSIRLEAKHLLKTLALTFISFSGRFVFAMQKHYLFFFFASDPLVYLGFYVTFQTVQVISRRVVGRAEETSTYSSSGFCTVNCRPAASNYQLSHLRPCQEPNPGLRGGRRECYHYATMAPSLCHVNIFFESTRPRQAVTFKRYLIYRG